MPRLQNRSRVRRTICCECSIKSAPRAGIFKTSARPPCARSYRNFNAWFVNASSSSFTRLIATPWQRQGARHRGSATFSSSDLQRSTGHFGRCSKRRFLSQGAQPWFSNIHASKLAEPTNPGSARGKNISIRRRRSRTGRNRTGRSSISISRRIPEPIWTAEKNRDFWSVSTPPSKRRRSVPSP